jgi:hypothetical protein
MMTIANVHIKFTLDKGNHQIEDIQQDHWWGDITDGATGRPQSLLFSLKPWPTFSSFPALLRRRGSVCCPAIQALSQQGLHFPHLASSSGTT